MDVHTVVRTTINLLLNMSAKEKKKYLKTSQPKCHKKIEKLLRILKSSIKVRKRMVRNRTMKEKLQKVPRKNLTRKKVMQMRKRKKVMQARKRKKVMLQKKSQKKLPKKRNQKPLVKRK